MYYLCNTHRKTFSNNPIKALQDWKVFIETGQSKLKNSDPYHATLYFGNAFEISQILLNQPCRFHKTQLKRIDRFMISGFYLSECYKRSQRFDEQHQLLMDIYNQLCILSSSELALQQSLTSNIDFTKALIDNECQTKLYELNLTSSRLNRNININ
jgi:hypothetical protein